MTDGPLLALAIVAAVARNRVIGGGNRLPWHLRSDLAHFKALSLGKPVIMGRKTLDSIPRSKIFGRGPLPGREIIVLSHDAQFHPPDVHVASTLAAAICRASDIGRRIGASEIIVAGGGQVFAQTIERATVLHLTEVDLSPEGDALFPPIDLSIWREMAREPQPRTAHDEADFSFVDYARIDGRAPANSWTDE